MAGVGAIYGDGWLLGSPISQMLGEGNDSLFALAEGLVVGALVFGLVAEALKPKY